LPHFNSEPLKTMTYAKQWTMESFAMD